MATNATAGIEAATVRDPGCNRCYLRVRARARVRVRVMV